MIRKYYKEMERKFEIIPYTHSMHFGLLQLLLQLHSVYFQQTINPEIQAIRKDKDAEKSFESYLQIIDRNESNNWQVFLAKEANEIIGFIIGSIEIDEYLELSPIGKLEDWYVDQKFRNLGIGMKLFTEIEKWFIEKGCKQISSNTWDGNQLGIKAHEQAGFFISGIKFSKKL